jgi:hypothetical protein
LKPLLISDPGSVENGAALGGEVVSTKDAADLQQTKEKLGKSGCGRAVLCSRPKSVADVAHQEEVVSTLTKALETANVGPFA